MVFNRKSGERPSDATQQPTQPSQPGAARATPPPPPPRQSAPVTIPSESVIGSDLTIEGQGITIRCRGALRVNGSINADVHSMQIVVGEHALISGGVAAESVNVFGRINGAIYGARVVLHPTASVEGDIHSQTLSIEQGASFDGRSRKVTNPAEIAPQLEPSGYSSAPAPSGNTSSQSHGSQSNAAATVTPPLPRLHS